MDNESFEGNNFERVTVDEALEAIKEKYNLLILDKVDPADHEALVQRLIEEGDKNFITLCSLNIEKFAEQARKAIALSLIEAGDEAVIYNKLQIFSPDDQLELLKRIVEKDSNYIIIFNSNLNQNTFSAKKLKELLVDFIEHDPLGYVSRYLDEYPASILDEIVKKLANSGKADDVMFYLHDFKNLELSTVILLIDKIDAEECLKIVYNLEKFEERNRKEIILKLMEKGYKIYADEMLFLPDKDQDEVAVKFIESGMANTLALILKELNLANFSKATIIKLIEKADVYMLVEISSLLHKFKPEDRTEIILSMIEANAKIESQDIKAVPEADRQRVSDELEASQAVKKLLDQYK